MLSSTSFFILVFIEILGTCAALVANSCGISPGDQFVDCGLGKPQFKAAMIDKVKLRDSWKNNP